jgi:hypothetical protein
MRDDLQAFLHVRSAGVATDGADSLSSNVNLATTTTVDRTMSPGSTVDQVEVGNDPPKPLDGGTGSVPGVESLDSTDNTVGLNDFERQDLLTSVWMSNDFFEDGRTKRAVTTSRSTIENSHIPDSTKITTNVTSSNAKVTEIGMQSKKGKHPSFLTEEKLLQLAATNKTGEIALQKTRNASRRHRFEDKLVTSENPRVTPSPSILERLRRHKAIRSLSESDRRSFETIFLLRMAAQHLIRLFLLTNDPVLVKRLYQGLLECKRRAYRKTKDRRKRFQSAQQGETQRV